MNFVMRFLPDNRQWPHKQRAKKTFGFDVDSRIVGFFADPWTIMSIISAEHALTNAGHVTIDVREHLSYQLGHVPGAVHLDLKQWEKLAKTPQGALERAGVWWPAIAGLGIDGRAAVIVYDDGRMTEAARTWFILQWHGVDVQVLDGGWPALLKVPSFKPEKGSHTPVSTTYAAPQGHVPTVGLVGRQTLKEQLDRSVQILDARTCAEHVGDDLKSNARGGHLPGAKLLEHASLLSADGRLKPPQQIFELLANAGIKRGASVVTHCDGGGRAALAALAAVSAGQQDVSAYYLSFSDWAKDETCPVVRS